MTLYIIGNGFDLKHDLPSRYSNFADYCKLYYPCLFEQVESAFPEISKDSLWSNFEEGLGEPSEKVLKDWYDLNQTDYGYKDLLKYLSKDYKTKDLEEFLKKWKDISKIIVLGHSLNKIDDTYFDIINRTFPEAKWYVDYTKCMSLIKKMRSVMRIGIKNVKYFKSK